MKLLAASIALCMALALAGCGRDEGGIRTLSVEVPTPVPCVSEIDIPAQTGVTELTGDARTDAGLLLAETIDLRAENGELRALIVPACTIISNDIADTDGMD